MKNLSLSCCLRGEGVTRLLCGNKKHIHLNQVSREILGFGLVRFWFRKGSCSNSVVWTVSFVVRCPLNKPSQNLPREARLSKRESSLQGLSQGDWRMHYICSKRTCSQEAGDLGEASGCSFSQRGYSRPRQTMVGQQQRDGCSHLPVGGSADDRIDQMTFLPACTPALGSLPELSSFVRTAD